MSCSLPFFLAFDYCARPVTGLKPSKGVRKVDVSKITPPTSPPSRTFDLSPPRVDPDRKRKKDDVEVEQVGEGGVASAGGEEGGSGVDTEVESSEATPRHTIYTKRVRSSMEGGASGTHHSPEFNANKQKEWEIACEQTNREMQTQREAIERASYQKRESEYLQRITKLQQLVTERSTEVWASEIIVEEANADSKWLLARGVPLIADRIVKSEELAKYMFELGEAAYDNGRKDGFGEGRSAAEAKEALENFDLYKTDCAARYAEKRQEYEFLEFAIVKVVGKLSRKPDGVELLKKALGDEDRETGGARPSHQD
ncbi:hypothetical protein Hanom_Chr16g01470371 [Helianthus anomalus]